MDAATLEAMKRLRNHEAAKAWSSSPYFGDDDKHRADNSLLADLALSLVAKIGELREAEQRFDIVFKTTEVADDLMPELYTLAGIEVANAT
jgi:hypothetical protein